MLKPRLQKFYEKIVCEDFVLLYNFTNISSLPTFERAIFHSTSNLFASDKYSLLQSFSALFLGTGLRPMKSRAHKSIAQFAIRKGNLLGVKVTLRKRLLFKMLDKMLIFVLPRYLFDAKSSVSLLPLQKKAFLPRVQSRVQPNTLLPLAKDAAALKIKDFKAAACQDKLAIAVESDVRLKSTSVTIANSERQEIYNRDCLWQKGAKNFIISSKHTTNFPEVSQLLMFFNSLAGFSFDCSFFEDFNTKSNSNLKNTILIKSNIKQFMVPKAIKSKTKDAVAINDFLPLKSKILNATKSEAVANAQANKIKDTEISLVTCDLQLKSSILKQRQRRFVKTKNMATYAAACNESSLNILTELPDKAILHAIKKAPLAITKKKQFVSAFQYPVNIIY